MARNYPNKMTAGELATLRAMATTIVDRFPHFRCLSVFDQVVMYRQLGLAHEQIDYIGELLELPSVRDHVDLSDGVLAPPESCPISWRPTVLTPVFWGRQIVEPDSCLPALTRIYYPSLDGAVQNAPLLQLCGRFPLVLFLHGHCQPEDNHVYRWERVILASPYFPRGPGGPKKIVAIKQNSFCRSAPSQFSILMSLRSKSSNPLRRPRREKSTASLASKSYVPPINPPGQQRRHELLFRQSPQ